MEQSNHEHEHEHERAYQRGRNVAKAWKRLSSAIKHWDNVCVGKVQERCNGQLKPDTDLGTLL
ncbi:hypothetical protein SOD10_39190 [Serratia plymuthica]|nr:hypothetical protein SOD10_39190 [Serratia plymuthica]